MSIKQVYDTSAIVSLSLIDMLDLPDLLNISFFIPSAVMEELQDISRFDDELANTIRNTILILNNRTTDLEEKYKILANRLSHIPKIGKGEAETLVLAYQISAEDVVIDDVGAMGSLSGIASMLDIRIVPSSYLIIKAYLQDLINYEKAEDALNKLAIKRGWYHSILYETALIMLMEAKNIKES